MVETKFEEAGWSDWKRVDTANGVMTMRTADVPSGFWPLWKIFKETWYHGDK